MKEHKSWQAFFDAQAPLYMQNGFTRNTIKEVDFVIEELGLAPGSRILDFGCGTGRHSVELARRGYRMTGVDQSVGMLAEARKAAQEADVEVEWVQADARQFSREGAFDGAICLCEGAFGLLETTGEAIEQPLAILRNISRALKPGAKTVFTTLNGYRTIRNHTQADVEKGTFDPLTLTETCQFRPRADLPPIQVVERAFVPTELTVLFNLAGLKPLQVRGGTAGKWNQVPINLDEIEIMVVAQKCRREEKETMDGMLASRISAIQFADCCAELRLKVFDSWKWLKDKYLHLENGFSILALDGEKPVGIISVRPGRLPPPLDNATEGYIDVIDVLVPYRRRGVARRLVEMSITRCRQMGLCQVRAWSSEDKVEAIPMWKALGFGLCPATEYPRGQAVKGYFVTYQL